STREETRVTQRSHRQAHWGITPVLRISVASPTGADCSDYFAASLTRSTRECPRCLRFPQCRRDLTWSGDDFNDSFSREIWQLLVAVHCKSSVISYSLPFACSFV
ncbi:hypothetical protein PMAYCL1PPCAC_26901, partial [Pristionchus mayeri]